MSFRDGIKRTVVWIRELGFEFKKLDFKRDFLIGNFYVGGGTTAVCLRSYLKRIERGEDRI